MRLHGAIIFFSNFFVNPMLTYWLSMMIVYFSLFIYSMLLRSKRFLFNVLSLLLLSYSVSGQDLKKTITKQNLAVAGYSADFELSPRLSVSAEIQERIYIDPVRQSQMFVKTHVAFEISKNFTFGNGIAYYLNTPIDPQIPGSFKIPEIRLNHDLKYRHNLKSIGVGHRYRMEERFIRKRLDDSLINGYRFVERISYMLSLEYKLLKSKNHEHDLHLKLSDGVYINTTKGTIYNAFDQNRFYAGLNYRVVKNMDVELGYTKNYQQRISGVEYLNRNIASLAISHSIKMYH